MERKLIESPTDLNHAVFEMVVRRRLDQAAESARTPIMKPVLAHNLEPSMLYNPDAERLRANPATPQPQHEESGRVQPEFSDKPHIVDGKTTSQTEAPIQDVSPETEVRLPWRKSRKARYGALGAAVVTSLALLTGAATHNDEPSAEAAVTQQEASDLASSPPAVASTPSPEAVAPEPTVDPNVVSPAPVVDPNIAVVPPAPEIAPVAPTPEAPKIIPSPQLELDVATWNVWAPNDVGNVFNGVTQILESSDVAAFIEFTGKYFDPVFMPLTQCGDACPNGGYYPASPITGNAGGSALAYDKRELTVVEEGVVQLNPRTVGLEKGAGNRDINERLGIHQTYMQNRAPLPEGVVYDQEPIYVVVWPFHPIASIESNGGADTSNPKRRVVYEQQVRVLEESINAHLSNPLYQYTRRLDIILGDVNYDINRNLARHNDGDPTNDDPYSPIELSTRLGFTWANLSSTAPLGGTHAKSGDREIDLIGYRASSKGVVGPAFPVSVEDVTYHPKSKNGEGGSYGSDHRAAQTKMRMG